MATLEEVTQTVADLTLALTETNSTLGSLDLKLDEIQTFINTLKGGSVVTQEQLDALADTINAAKLLSDEAKSKSSGALTETDALDD